MTAHIGRTDMNSVSKLEILLKSNIRAVQLAKLASGVAKFWNIWGQVLM